MDNPFVPKRVVAARRTLVERYFEFFDTKRPSDKLFFYAAALIAIVSGALLLLQLNNAYTVSVPSDGGVLREGIIGSPRFVNPVLAITRADQDLVALIYDGLMTIDERGALVPDLAESVTVSSDATVYNVVLREGLRFHDGTLLTADDVLFTIDLIQNPALKSPLQGNFDGVVTEKVSERELNLILEEPYAPFLENLTVGIVPQHEWEGLSVDQIPFSQHNTEPTGSGPYRIASVQRNDAGLIDGYTLTAFREAQHAPKIGTIAITFFGNESALAEALRTGEVDSATGLGDTSAIIDVQPALGASASPLPRTFGVFFNQNRSAVLRQPEVRAALELALDRDELTTEVLEGGARPMTGPIPPSFLPQSLATTSAPDTRTPAGILERNGWTRTDEGIWSTEIDGSETELRIDIATANLPFLMETASYLERAWTDIGARVSVRTFEQTDLTQAVIRTRDYEALLFGTAIGRSLDLYPFWHSSQRNDPGLNVALYANITADAALAKARIATSTAVRDEALGDFLTEFRADSPAIFLFVPTLNTVAPTALNRTTIERLVAPHERFANVADWYIRTESLWPIFTGNSE